MRFRLGWMTTWIGLHATWWFTLPVFLPFFIWQAIKLLKPGAAAVVSPQYIGGCLICGALWLSLGFFWSRALAVFVAPQKEEERYAQAPAPFYMALLLIFVAGIVLMPYLPAWPRVTVASPQLPLYARAISMGILVIGYQVAYSQGWERGMAAKNDRSSLFARLLERSRKMRLSRNWRGQPVKL